MCLNGSTVLYSSIIEISFKAAIIKVSYVPYLNSARYREPNDIQHGVICDFDENSTATSTISMKFKKRQINVQLVETSRTSGDNVRLGRKNRSQN